MLGKGVARERAKARLEAGSPAGEFFDAASRAEIEQVALAVSFELGKRSMINPLLSQRFRQASAK
jgi:hypothetical protein